MFFVAQAGKRWYTFTINEIVWEEKMKMEFDKLVARINELAKKSRGEGLSDAEKDEQATLRKEYIAKFRQGMENTLSNVYIVDEKGNKKKVQKKK